MVTNLARSEGEAMMFAALHNVGMLGLLLSQEVLKRENPQWDPGDDFDFIQHNGQYVFPTTLPENTCKMIQQQLGANKVVFIQIAESKKEDRKSPLLLPGDF